MVLFYISRSITPVHEINTDRVRDLGRLNPNVIRLFRSITPVNEIDTETVKVLVRVNHFVRLSRSIISDNLIWFDHIENNVNNDTTQSLECLLLEIKFTIPI